MDNKDILEMELSEEDASRLAEEIQAWKEETVAKLEEEAEAKIQAKIDELDELNNAWKEEVAEAYSDKFISALNEMREDVRAEVLAESVNSDPTHKVMEEVCRLVAPIMNEEYEENTYMSEIKSLKSKLSQYEEKEKLAEGKQALEDLIENYDDNMKAAIRALIGEGSAEEVTSKFEALVESLGEVSSNKDEHMEEEEDDFDFDFEDDENNSDIDEEESDEFSSIIDEEFEDDQDIRVKSGNNALRSSMMRLV